MIVGVGDARDGRQVRRVDAERGRHRRFVADDGDPAVVWDVQRLVGVGRPRIGALGSRQRDAASAGMPPPTARTRRRRAPTRRADGRRRWPPRSRRTRPSGHRRPEGRRWPGRRAPPARRSARRRRSGPARRLRRSPGSPSPARRPASTTDAWTASPGEEADLGAFWMPRDASWPRSRSTASRATMSADRLALVRAGHESDPAARGQAQKLEQPARRDLFERGRRRRELT